MCLMDEHLAEFLRKEVVNKMTIIIDVNKFDSDKSDTYMLSQF